MEYILTLFLYVNNDLVRKLEQPVATAAVCQQLSAGLNFRDPAVTTIAVCRPRVWSAQLFKNAGILFDQMCQKFLMGMAIGMHAVWPKPLFVEVQ